MCLFGHTKSWFSNQISNPGPLIWEHKSLSHCSTSEIPTPVFLPAELHGQRSLVGYSPWGLKEWDTTEWTEHARAHTCYLPGLCFIKSHLKRRKWQPTPVLLPGESHVQRSLVHRGAWSTRSQRARHNFTFTFKLIELLFLMSSIVGAFQITQI